jgi:hypothetical protein
MIAAGRWLAFIVCLSFCACAAPMAMVETRSGDQLSGELKIEPGRVTLMSTNGPARAVALSELKRLRVLPAGGPTNSLTILSNPPEHGLLGIYFNTPDCTGEFFKTRYDSAIDFDWGQSAPFADMNSNGFSVRWAGSLVVSNSEHYTFHTVTDDGVRLWINNKLIIDAWKDEFLNLAAAPLVLIGGQTNEIRMEMFDARDRAVARLFWSSPTTPRSIIPKERLRPAANVPLPTTPATKSKYSPGVLLANGSALPGTIESLDRSSLRLAGTSVPFSRVQIARIMFQDTGEQQEAALQRGRTGVLLKSGDFVEGDINGIRNGEIDVGSVVLGSKKVSVNQAVAVILRDVRPAAANYEVTTRNGGLYRTSILRLQNDTVLVSDAAFGSIKIEPDEIRELRAIKAD